MTSVARPGTPFPSERTSYFSAGPSRQQRYSPQSLHFPLPELPTPTPPSLLKRTGSSGSSRPASLRRGISTNMTSTTSTSASASTSTYPYYRGGGLSSPSALGSLGLRRESTASSSSGSSSVSLDSAEPVTPVMRHQLEHDIGVVDEDEEDNESVGPFSLDDARTHKLASTPEMRRPALSKQSFSALSEAYYHASERVEARPRLIRRGTPRPAESLSSLSISPKDGEDRRYISMIDGGAWIIRERR